MTEIDRRYRESEIPGKERRIANKPQHILVESVEKNVKTLIESGREKVDNFQTLQEQVDPNTQEVTVVVIDTKTGLPIAEQRTNPLAAHLDEEKAVYSLFRQNQFGQQLTVSDISYVNGNHTVQVSNGEVNTSFIPNDPASLTSEHKPFVHTILEQFNLPIEDSGTIFDASKIKKK